MTQEPRTRASRRHDRHEANVHAHPHKGPVNKPLLVVLVILTFVLLVLLYMLLRQPDTPPAPPSLGQQPQPLLVIPGPGEGDAPLFVRPLAAAWGADGMIYVSDTGNARVCVFDAQGRFLRELGRLKPSVEDPDEALIQPAGIAVDSEGVVYVADLKRSAVMVYDRRGRFDRRIEPRKTRQAWVPTDVAVAEGALYVTDTRGLSVFDEDERLSSKLASAAGAPLAYPNGVAVAPRGGLALSDTNSGRVLSLDPSSTVTWVVGPESGGQRVIGLPRGLDVSENGTTLVADAFLFGVARINPDGVYMDRYGQRGSLLGQFEFPNDVDIRGSRVLVTDKENNRVQVLEWPGLVATTP